ncbi:hypothetical protein NBH00_06745 [Paraconexibacter antarcticus]|uniref:Glycosyltransferase RgtA/B/C/D-like domain-containing protein n=1 Tax=Paraconexibacter antarcticus TaxID=2949664 RepID=A0ABY5DZB3_9ACTN|nr:hypothetical protein [Paraconexibacter antarcticus]UTI65904.1 hypothetical protein NBH00_06745 [Paraconexibacter antarcticus]
MLVLLTGALLFLGVGAFVTPDTWLAIAAGRVVAGGIPHHDTLTAWTVGHRWIDQQWLGQLVLYDLWRAGGVRLLGAVNALAVVGSLTVVLVGARRRGGAPRQVVLVGLVAAVPLMLVAGNIRTQSLALPLFAAVLALLCSDSRTPSRRVFWVIPLLVLWANVHGSVFLGVALVGVAAACRLRDAAPPGERAATVLLVLLAGATLVATPYGLEIFAYVGDLAGNGEVRNVASDWMPVTLEPIQVPALVLAAGAVLAIVSSGSTLSLFERVALGLLLVAALSARRNLGWFGLAGALMLPACLPARRSPRSAASVAGGAATLISAVGAVVVAAVHGLGDAPRQVDRRFPPAAAAVISRAVAADPTAPIFVHPRYADWLLVAAPSLTGHIPFDIRYELLSEAELRRFRRVRGQVGDGWRSALGGARLIVLDRSERPLGHLPSAAAVLLQENGSRAAFVRGRIVVIVLGAPPRSHTSAADAR